ncbi:MAG: CHAD domain-containing protein [Gallionellaceae bacterium]|nr:CHAD domain-containing protein [Gallionellaceae bacterium]
MAIEIELKLAIAPDEVARLRRHPLLKGVKPVRRKLYGIYFDTPGFDLFKARGAFRLRREGRHWVQTVKLERGGTAGLSARPEYEVRVAGSRPDLAVLPAEARAALKGAVVAGLAPVFVTDFWRTAWLLERPRGTLEIALDLGCIRAGDAELPVAEVELELKGGDGAVLFEVARELLEAAPMVPEYRSKALRGYGLAGVWRETPGKAALVEVARDLPAAEAWRRSLLAGLDQLGRNLPGLLTADDPEYLHQARVAVRRLVTMLTLGRAIGCAREDWLAGLRGFMDELSPARDWDVFVTDTLAAVRAGLPQPERLDGLLARAAEARLAARRRARVAAGDRRLTALLLDMGVDLLAERGDGPPLVDWAGSALDKRWRRFARLAGHFSRLDTAGRHAVRIAAKRLRYTGEAFAALHGGKAARYLERLGRLQDELGAANDIVVARRLLAALDGEGGEAYAIGLVEGYLAALAGARHGGLAGRVARMVEVRPFWR